MSWVELSRLEQVNLDAPPSKCMSQVLNHSRLTGLIITLTFEFWLLTFETFSAMSSHMTNIYGKFHWNPSTKYRDIASHEIGVNGRTDNGRTDGRSEKIMHPPLIVGGGISMDAQYVHLKHVRRWATSGSLGSAWTGRNARDDADV